MKPLDPRSRSLIDDARAADVPPPELEARLWDTLVTRFDAPLPPTAAAAHSALATKVAVTGASALWLKVVAGMIAVGAGGVGVHAVMRHDTPTTHPAATTQPSAARPTPSPTLATAPSAMAPQPSAAAPTRTASRSLQAETALLARAQRALGAGTPAAALPWIQQHAARFPNGELAQEREAARVLALCALQRTNEAHTAIQSFLRTWPTSPLADRVRAACTAR